MSALVRECLEEYLGNVHAFWQTPDTDEQVSSVLTVYVPNDTWFAARDQAYANGRIPISVIIRKGLLEKMTAQAA